MFLKFSLRSMFYGSLILLTLLQAFVNLKENYLTFGIYFSLVGLA